MGKHLQKKKGNSAYWVDISLLSSFKIFVGILLGPIDLRGSRDKIMFLKLASAIFYQILVFPQNSPFKTMKSVFYFIKKTLFVFEIFLIL